MKRLLLSTPFFLLFLVMLLGGGCSLSGNSPTGTITTQPMPTVPGLNAYLFSQDSSHEESESLSQIVQGNHLYSFVTQHFDELLSNCYYAIPNYGGGFFVVTTKFGDVYHIPGVLDPLLLQLTCGLNTFQDLAFQAGLLFQDQGNASTLHLSGDTLIPPQDIQSKILAGDAFFVLVTNNNPAAITPIIFVGPWQNTATFYIYGLGMAMQQHEDIMVRLFKQTAIDKIEIVPTQIVVDGL